MSVLDFSVVIATLNPDPHILRWALDSLDHQTLDHDRFEVVIIDNNSSKPVRDYPELQNRSFAIRVIHEAAAGTTPARCRGIREANAEWIVFLDDDNSIAPNYLEEALRIIQERPQVGAFGGISHYLSDARDAGWSSALLPYVGVRNYGHQEITSQENKWGEWEPIGAGMVFRRSIGQRFVELVGESAIARKLGRTRQSYICGEDSLLARCAYQQGYACSYQPTLSLTHFIRSQRLQPKILAKTIEGVARGWVICETVFGTTDFPRISVGTMLRELVARFRHRCRLRGLKAGSVEWFWDVGYLRQVRELQKNGKA